MIVFVYMRQYILSIKEHLMCQDSCRGLDTFLNLFVGMEPQKWDSSMDGEEERRITPDLRGLTIVPTSTLVFFSTIIVHAFQ